MSLNERLEFLIHVNAEGAVKGFKTVGDEAEHSLTKAQSSLDKTGAKMTKVGSGMVVGAGLIGIGLFELSKKWEESALAAGKLSTATGLTVEEASRWSVVAKGADIDTATLTSSLGKMDKAIQATPQKFADLGAEIIRTKDGAIDTSATFLNVVDALDRAGGAANNAQTATAILGKGWQGMAEILDKSSGDLKASLAAVSDQQVFNEDDVSQAEQFRDTMKELSNNAQGLALTLGKSAAPVISDVTSALSSMVGGLTAADTASGGMIGKFTAIAALGIGAAGALSVIGGQAIKMRNRLMPVGEDGSRSLGKLGMAAVGVGVAVAAFTVVSDIMGQHAKQVAADVGDLDKRMQALGLTADEAAKQKITEFAAKSDLMTAAMDKSKLSVTDLQDAIVGGKDKLEAFITKLEAGGGAASRTQVSVGSLGPEIRHLGEAYDQLSGQLSTTEKATEALGETQAETDKKSAASQKAYTDGALAANKELVASEEGVVKAHQDELKARQDVTDAARAAIDAKYGYAKAEQATKEAIEQSTATLKDNKATENDKTDAVFAGVDAALAQAAAYVTMKGDQDNAKAANQDMIESLYGTAIALAPDSPIRASILAYIAELQGIPKDVSTTVTTAYVDTGAVGAHHDSYTPTHTTGKVVTSGNPQGGGQWTGTENAPAGVQDVAENGMELVVGRQARNFRGGEQVVNARGTAALLGGRTVNVTNHFHGITDIGQLTAAQSRQLGWDLRKK